MNSEWSIQELNHVIADRRFKLWKLRGFVVNYIFVAARNGIYKQYSIFIHKGWEKKFQEALKNGEIKIFTYCIETFPPIEKVSLGKDLPDIGACQIMADVVECINLLHVEYYQKLKYGDYKLIYAPKAVKQEVPKVLEPVEWVQACEVTKLPTSIPWTSFKNSLILVLKVLMGP